MKGFELTAVARAKLSKGGAGDMRKKRNVRIEERRTRLEDSVWGFIVDSFLDNVFMDGIFIIILY